MESVRIGYLTLAVAALLVGCATVRSPGARPDDMSAARHQAVAARYRARAAAQAQKFDPKAKGERYTGGVPGFTDSPTSFEYWPEEYNPTEKYLEQAQELREHARQHQAAATALRRFEEKACRRFPEKIRARCPLLGLVDRVEPIEGGARILLRKGVRLDTALAHMRCHYAYGRSVGRRGMTACPLYLKDIRIRRSADGKAIEIVSDRASLAREILRRTRVTAHRAHRD